MSAVLFVSMLLIMIVLLIIAGVVYYRRDSIFVTVETNGETTSEQDVTDDVEDNTDDIKDISKKVDKLDTKISELDTYYQANKEGSALFETIKTDVANLKSRMDTNTMSNFLNTKENDLIIGNKDEVDNRIKLISDVETKMNLSICNNETPKVCYNMFVDENDDLRIAKSDDREGRVIIGNDALIVDSRTDSNKGIYHKNGLYQISDIVDYTNKQQYYVGNTDIQTYIPNYVHIRNNLSKQQQANLLDYESGNGNVNIPVVIEEKTALLTGEKALTIRDSGTDRYFIAYPFSRHLQPVIIDTQSDGTMLKRTSVLGTEFGTANTANTIDKNLLRSGHFTLDVSGTTYQVNYVVAD